MNFGKMLLLGAAGFLGYKLVTGASPYAAGDVSAAQLVEAAKQILDPAKQWTISALSTGAVSITTADGTTSQQFPTVAAALAWINQGKPHGGTANVTFYRRG